MAARSLLSAYVLVSVLNVIAVATGNTSGEQLTKPLLMPLLAGWLLAEIRRHWTAPLTWLLVGLTAAWIGDLVLLGTGDVALLLGMAAFLVPQMSYLIAFTRVRGLRFRRAILVPGPEPVRGVVARHPILIVPFALILIGFAWLLWPELFEGRDCAVEIETEGRVRGRSTIDWNGRLRKPTNAFVVDSVQATTLFERVIERLSRLP